MKQNKKPQDNTILQLMEVLSEKSQNTQMNMQFWKENRTCANELARRLSVTKEQGVLLSICLRRGPRNVDFDDISRHLDISNIRALFYSEDINALIRKKYLKYRDARDEDSFDVPVSVIRALKNNETPEQPICSGLTSVELFDYMDTLYRDLDDSAISPKDLHYELKELMKNNEKLGFVQELEELHIDAVSPWMLLVFFCHLLVNKDDDRVCYHQLEDLYPQKSVFYQEKSLLRSGMHLLMRMGLVEHLCDDGQVDTDRIHLSKKAKTLLLADFHLKTSEANIGSLIKPENLTAKDLFYTSRNERQVDELCHFFTPETYSSIRFRMKDGGFRSGFACLFYGAPGTGKTETVYQLARQTSRSIMAVNVPDIKSKWVGESEKNIQEVFDRYRYAVERSELAPILLFNEADGILCIRQEGAQRSVDKMENTIQNIILQEMEKLDGILIATTNLTQNLDPAFERRFLYKICFDRPDTAVREKICHTMIPALSEEQCSILASAYELSGGQMENVARKYSINVMLYGTDAIAMDALHALCNEEQVDCQRPRRIGF